jgi:hypothetical protein
MRTADALLTTAAAVAASVAGTLWWMLVDEVPAVQAFRSPFPYLLLAVACLVAAPAYIAMRRTLAGSLWRLLVFVTVAACPSAIMAVAVFPLPRGVFAALLLVSTAWVATVTFWGVLRMSCLG